MNVEQIIKIIRAEEKQLYVELCALKRMYGNEDKSTKYAGAQWNAILTILEKIEDEINENN